jgi:hypothetical protein
MKKDLFYKDASVIRKAREMTEKLEFNDKFLNTVSVIIDDFIIPTCDEPDLNFWRNVKLEVTNLYEELINKDRFDKLNEILDQPIKNNVLIDDEIIKD